jgi:hypothetical protein
MNWHAVIKCTDDIRLQMPSSAQVTNVVITRELLVIRIQPARRYLQCVGEARPHDRSWKRVATSEP